MGKPESVVTVFARNGGRILLQHTDLGWDGITRPLTGSPEESAEAALSDILAAPSGSRVVRAGTGVAAPDGDGEVYPVLVEVYTRALADTSNHFEWRHPTILVREASHPGSWDAYTDIAPALDEIVSDSLRGSTTLSLEALQVLRDGAARGDSWENLVRQARRLVSERNDLTALVTRVDHAMNRAAKEQTPDALERITCEELDEAVRSDEEAAAQAAEYCEGETVLTLSQSGTVQAALSKGNPQEVYLLESRPACEAISVAETLAAEGLNVSLLLDAAVCDLMARTEIDLVLIGADSVDPNGDVRNKVGTRMLAMAADHEDIPVIAATSSDKIANGPAPEVWVAGHDIYDGPYDIDTPCRMFDRTPPDLITELVTEAGTLTPEMIVWVAAERRANRLWRDRPERLQSV